MTKIQNNLKKKEHKNNVICKFSNHTKVSESRCSTLISLMNTKAELKEFDVDISSEVEACYENNMTSYELNKNGMGSNRN